MPRISVLMPCRDAAATVDEALASIEAQTLSDFEIIAVDDGSRDDTPNVLDRRAAADRRIRILGTEERGIVAALRLAARHATGELLARMDADDIAHPLRFARQIERFEQCPRIQACGTGVRYFPDDAIRGGARRYEAWINSLVEPADLERDVFVECPIAHPTLMLRREAHDRVGGYIERPWPEDYDLILRLWAARLALAGTPDVLLRWRDRPDRLSRTDPRYSPAAFRRCKAWYLREHLLDGRAVVVWGAGPVGKAFARVLLDHRVPVHAFVDLDPRKIGQIMHGAPVIAPDALGAFPGRFVVAAVGSARGRAEIRTALRRFGRVEMRDFCAIA